jgi:hypothetical protein
LSHTRTMSSADIVRVLLSGYILQQIRGQTSLDSKFYKRVVAILRPIPCFVLENIITEPHAQDISAKVAGSIPWKQQKVAVGYDDEVSSADVRMAASGLLGSRYDPGVQGIKISAWGKVDVDRTEKVRGSGEKHHRI